jgi:hypothetical protein
VIAADSQSGDDDACCLGLAQEKLLASVDERELAEGHAVRTLSLLHQLLMTRDKAKSVCACPLP